MATIRAVGRHGAAQAFRFPMHVQIQRFVSQGKFRVPIPNLITQLHTSAVRHGALDDR